MPNVRTVVSTRTSAVDEPVDLRNRARQLCIGEKVAPLDFYRIPSRQLHLNVLVIVVAEDIDRRNPAEIAGEGF